MPRGRPKKEVPKPKTKSTKIADYDGKESEGGSIVESLSSPLEPSKPSPEDQYAQDGILLMRGTWEDLRDLIPDKSVKLICIDPPYSSTDAEWDIEPQWVKLSATFQRILDDLGQIAIFGTEESLMTVHKNILNYCFELRFTLMWVKPNGFWTSWKMPTRRHECIWIYAKSGVKVDDLIFNHQEVGKRCVRDTKSTNTTSELVGHHTSKGEGYRNAMHPTTVIFADNVGAWSKEYSGHSTQKPIKVMDLLIRLLSNEGDTVFDCFMGSGSTGVSCKRLGRKFIGIEVQKRFFDIAIKRIEKAKGASLEAYHEDEESEKEGGEESAKESRLVEPGTGRTDDDRKEGEEGGAKEVATTPPEEAKKGSRPPA